jgi:hypothetical protein
MREAARWGGWTLRAPSVTFQRQVPSDHRDEFEQRVLSLVRAELEACDEAYAAGYGIGRFALLYEVLVPREEDQDALPWAHNWNDHSQIEFAFSDTSFWSELALVREVQDKIENDRSDVRWDARHPPDEHEEDEEEE